MKKIMLKLIPAIIAILIFAGFGLVPTNKAKASADDHCTESSGFSMCAGNAWPNDSDVEALLQYRYLDRTFYWEMYLQRYENGKWNTIGTRTGYVSATSYSNRTFTNVAKKNAPIRVYLQLYTDSARTKSYAFISTPSWIR